MIYCQYGFRRDSNGHVTCTCKKSPCDNDETPLEGYFCGRSPNRRACPSTHQCAIAPNDAYAVCCPRAKQPSERSLQKSGECPSPSSSGLMGICIARCTRDNDCEGEQKCCGGCPRQCVKPVFA
ncbi:unnamed protein product [Rotaria sordida]|uniref:WAP domain-containing protein n=1 Tax=Rotaria sordida TaxID=392033 RepID=A0A814PDU8_9BILA|nr:unnamed protein product [Rotaria sordida]CAF0868222.1 unnamed protein product [Rotaria sordida]CAF1005427.1 unnamed protein product [Rotaria sordida]CAF1102356.1 unnamed protein product [Rotaria sordida]CAF3687340.1 unnamed protein product [Rotaria sordida]